MQYNTFSTHNLPDFCQTSVWGKNPGLPGAHCWFGWPFRVATLHTTGALRRYRGSSNQVVGLWPIDLCSYCLYLASGDKGPGVGRDQLLRKHSKKKPQAFFVGEKSSSNAFICFLPIFFWPWETRGMSGFFGLNVKPILDLGHGAVDCNYSIPCLEYQRGTRAASLMWQSQVHLDAMLSCQAWGGGDAGRSRQIFEAGMYDNDTYKSHYGQVWFLVFLQIFYR